MNSLEHLMSGHCLKVVVVVKLQTLTHKLQLEFHIIKLSWISYE